MKPDWAIFSLMATAMGYPMEYRDTEQIWDELRGLCPLYAGVSYDKMADLKSVQWPCPTEDHPGTSTLFEGNVFTTPERQGPADRLRVAAAAGAALCRVSAGAPPCVKSATTPAAP